jgi:hypothetical protein
VKKPKIINLIFVLFLALQVIGIINARFTETKFFCWVPYDQISSYSIRVKINNQLLTNSEIKKRFRKEAVGRENRNIHNLIAIIEQYEQSYGAEDSASVELVYITNGQTDQHWYWPKN